MVIGIDASRANKDFKTGTEWYSYYLIKNLIEIDRKNKYILYSNGPLQESFLQDLNLEKNTNVKIRVLKWPFRFLWTLGRLSLEMIFRSPDVLFVPAHSLPFFFPRKTINTIHDIAFVKNDGLYDKDVSCDNSKSNDRIINIIVKFLTFGKYCFKLTDHLNWSTRFAVKKARRIIAVSNFTKKELLSTYKKARDNRIAVVHNGYNNNIYRKIEDEGKMKDVLSKYGIEEPFFLYVGRVEKKKNILNLIEGFAILKENNKEIKEKLVLIGSAGFGYDNIKYLIEELGVDNNVLMLGWTEEQDLPYIFNKARAFVFPSFYEGFGIPILQSMACGAPVLLSDIEVFREVAQDSALFFDHLDPVDIALKMDKIINEPDLRKKISERGLIRASEFSWKKCAQETLIVIEST